MSHIMCLWLDLSFPCVVWLDQYVSMFVHVLVAFSTCFMLYAMARSFFLMCWCKGYILTCLYDVVGYALLGSMCFMCLFPCHMVRSLSSHAYYAWIHVLPWLCAKFLHICMHVSIPRGLYLCFRMLVRLDLCSLHALCHLPCAYALHVLFICLSLDLVCHAMCYCSPFVPFIAFSCVMA